MDSLDRLAILELATGRRIKTLDIGNTTIQAFNSETDRIYLVSEDGLVQCLHETQLSEPIRHVETCETTYGRIMAEMRAASPADKEAEDATDADEEEAAANNTEEEDEDPSDAFSDDEDEDPSSAFGSDEEEDDGSAFDEDDGGFGEDDEEDPFQ